MNARIETDVCVIGGGPAGMAFALALAARGHGVVVVERGRTFERSFRGESIAPDSIGMLRRLGVLTALRDQGALQVRGMELQDGAAVVLRVDFGTLSDAAQLPIEVPQPMLLETLATAAGQHPGFRLMRGTSATALVRDRDRVVGVRARRDDAEVEVRARLTVGADGRYSKAREWAGLEHQCLPLSRDFLWFTMPAPDVWTNDTYRIRISGRQHAMCIPTYPDLVRVGFNIEKGGVRELRAQGLDALHARIDRLAPELSDGIRQHLGSWSKTGMLDIFTTVVPQWSVPGLILLGDAAHTLTPVLAQGINHAIIDGVSLAPMVSHALAAPAHQSAIDAVVDGFQRLRAPAVARARALQLRQERLFTLTSRPAQALRRLLYRGIDRAPAIKRRIWLGLYDSETPTSKENHARDRHLSDHLGDARGRLGDPDRLPPLSGVESVHPEG